jgi:hypothetical protein
MDLDETWAGFDSYLDASPGSVSAQAQAGPSRRRRALQPVTRSTSNASGKRPSREDDLVCHARDDDLVGRANKKTKCSEGGEIEV